MQTLSTSRAALRGAAAALQLSLLPARDPREWAWVASPALQWVVPHALLSVVEGPAGPDGSLAVAPAAVLEMERAERRRHGIALRAVAPELESPVPPLALHARALLEPGRARVYSLWRRHRPFDRSERLIWREVVAARRQEASRNPDAEPHVRLANLVRSARLSPKQATVARYAASGLSNEQIAARLGISVETVKTHLAAVYTKSGLRGRRQLAAHVFGAALEARKGAHEPVLVA